MGNSRASFLAERRTHSFVLALLLNLVVRRGRTPLPASCDSPGPREQQRRPPASRDSLGIRE